MSTWTDVLKLNNILYIHLQIVILSILQKVEGRYNSNEKELFKWKQIFPFQFAVVAKR